jgi:hypothetical protein
LYVPYVGSLLSSFPSHLVLLRQPTRRKSKIQAAQNTMTRIGHQLLNKGKVVAAELEEGRKESDVQGRDLLSLLIRANMSSDLPDSQRLSDEDVLARTCPMVHIADMPR